ncbi:transmembrane 17B-like [Pelobates cultripes]|uniref:Transmembrane 17B-like n=1 Tax=Pelobates cultripes TaxID=61616 RepID=A0AAD1SA27_PELCU|nr:transmembrane 17B-like [Pelobates cultripes]
MALHTPLPCNIRHSLASISGSLFTQNKTRDCGGDRQSYHTGHNVGANLPLQMLLYFNSLFFPFWFMSEILILELKIIGLSILTLVECLRLYLGYIGNLYEKVPELAAFLLLTFMIQTPLILFLLTDEEVLILPLEYAVHAIYTVFLSMELVVSFFVLKVMTRTLATEFFLNHSDDTEKDLPGRNLCQGM